MDSTVSTGSFEFSFNNWLDRSTNVISSENNNEQGKDLGEEFSGNIMRCLMKQSFTLVTYSLRRLSIKMSLSNLAILVIVLEILFPRVITYTILYPIFRLVFGNLYPAYASYKAVRTKNVKEYVKWMMYWIVFALFTCAETFTDVFFSFWFPFYYEIKTILVFWLLSPATKGSSILYRRFVHPALIRREAEIDEALAKATEQGYTAVLHLGTKSVNYATTVLMQTAIKGGGGLVQHLKKSYSLSDLTGEKEDENRNTHDSHDGTDLEVEPRRREHPGRRGYSPRRTQSSSNRVEMYFPEVDVDVRQPRPREPVASLTSSDDISSGYSSGEVLQSHRSSQGDSLVRTASVGGRTRIKPRTTTKKTPEDAVEDPENFDLTPSTNVSLPSPLNLVTPEQALELLLLLSQNSNINEYINLDRGCPVQNNDDLGKTGQSGPKLEEQKVDSKKSSTEYLDTVSQVEFHKPTETVRTIIPDNSEKLIRTTPVLEARVQEPVIEPVRLEEASNSTNIAASIETATTSENLIKPAEYKGITDEICRDKFEELKQLLSDTHKAVNDIVHSQEKLKLETTQSSESLSQLKIHPEDASDTSKLSTNEIITTNDTNPNESQDTSLADEKTSEKSCFLESNRHTSSPDISGNVSRSSTDSLNRAGKYHKKPAPKVPIAKNEDDFEETESQSALKATLVIKTGTLKTFSNSTTTKDVFVMHAPEKSKSKKSKRQRTKEGFSKLLTIPKTIFHNAFSKEHKESNTKADDSNSLASETSDSASRSNSIASQDVIVELVPKESEPSDETSSTEALLDTASNIEDSSDRENVNQHVNQNMDFDINDDKAGNINENDENQKIDWKSDSEKDSENKMEITDPPEIREMSQSPRAAKKIVSDI